MNSTDAPDDDIEMESKWQDYLFAALAVLVLLIGIPGNMLVIIVVRKTPSMWSTTNFLLVNLACADLLTLLFIPFLFNLKIIHPRKKLAADYLCKFVTGSAITQVTITVSVVTLTVIAVERYRALLHPFNLKLKLNEKNVIYAIVVIWIVSISLAVPYFKQFYFDVEFDECEVPYDTYQIVHTIVLSFLPAVIIGFCYLGIVRGLYITNTIYREREGSPESRSDLLAKRKLCKLLMIVTGAFYVCYLPLGILLAYLCIAKLDDDEEDDAGIPLAEDLCSFFVFLNACLNPIIYAFKSSNYKQGFKKMCQCGRERANEEQQHPEREYGNGIENGDIEETTRN